MTKRLRPRLAAAACLTLAALALASLAGAETIQKGSLRIAFDGRITPRALPREGSAPIAVEVSTKISASPGKKLSQLRKISLAINRYGRLDATGLPVCAMTDIQPATTAKALAACRRSLVGEGLFSAEVSLSRQASFPSTGKALAFHGSYEGKPAILVHVYGSEPVPISFTLPFLITSTGGNFGTVLTATLPKGGGNFVTGLELSLSRSYRYRGQARSYASASCPAPRGFPSAVFPFAKATYEFAGGRKVTSTLTRTCRVRG